MKFIIILLFTFIMPLNAASYLPISGTVRDAVNGSSIAGAKLYLLRNNLTTVSDSDGTFTFNLKNSIQTSLRHSQPDRVTIHRGRVLLNVSKAGTFKIDIYTLSGRLLFTYTQHVESGAFTFTLPRNTHGCSVIRVSLNNQTFQCKNVNLLKSNTLLAPRSGAATASPLNRESATAEVIDSMLITKAGYTDNKIGVPASIDDMILRLQPQVLNNGVKPGVWTGTTSQKMSYAIHINQDGHTIDSLSIKVMLRCYALGSASHTFLVSGPFSIPENGVVSIGDSLELSFTFATVTGSFKSGYTTQSGGGCTREYWVLYNSGWRLEGYEKDPNQEMYLAETVTFTNALFPLNAAVVNGSISRKNPDKEVYARGERVEVTVTGDPDCHFIGWSGDTVLTNATTAIMVITDSSAVTATFEKDFVLATPALHGTIRRFPDKPSYKPNDTVKIVATCTASNCRTLNWTGETLRTNRDTAWVVMTSDKTIEPVFGEVCLLIITGGPGRVSREPLKEYYLPEDKDTVCIIAYSDTSMRFTGWKGEYFRTSNDTAWVIMDTTRTVEATFINAHIVASIPLDNEFNTICFSPVDNMLYLLSSGDTTKVYAADSGLLVNAFASARGSEPVISPDGSQLLFCVSQELQCVNPSTGALIFTIPAKITYLSDPSYSPDGSTIIMSVNDSTIRRWRATDGSPLDTLKGHTALAAHAVYSHDGSKIASISLDSSIILWNASTGKAEKRFHVNLIWPREPAALSFTDNDAAVHAFLTDGDILTYSCSDGTRIDSIATKISPIAASFSCDATLLAYGTWNRGAGVFDLLSKKLVMPMGSTKRESQVTGVALSKDKHYAAHVSSDSTLVVWRLK